jgi:hypothetical protein
MRTRTFLISAFAVAVVTLAATATLLAHDQLFPGTVMTVEAAKIQVNTIDAKTKKETPMWFEIADDTKVKRGDVVVTYAAAKITKGERIVVVVNHDDGRTAATELRLAAAKEVSR